MKQRREQERPGVGEGQTVRRATESDQRWERKRPKEGPGKKEARWEKQTEIRAGESDQSWERG